MDTSAFITSLVTSLLIFIVLTLLYVILSRRPSNYPVYYPALLLRGSNPEEAVFRGPMTWFQEAWRAKEQEIIDFAGLDAAVYIHLLDAALKILGYTALFCVPALVTISALSNNYETQKKMPNSNQTTKATFSGFDKLAMGNIPAKSNKIWVFGIGAYWLSIVTYLVLWKKYHHIANLRNAQLSSAKAKPEHFAVLVRDIPKPTNATPVEEVDAYFKRIHPETFERAVPVTNLSTVTKLWTKLEKTKAKLARAEVMLALSKSKGDPEGIRPQHKTGTLGLFGSKVDSINVYKEQIGELRSKHDEDQKKTRAGKQQTAAIIVFNSRTAAAAAAQSTFSPLGNKWQTAPAPEPREVVWENLHIPYYRRLIRQALVYFIVFLTILFYMIPIGFISAVTTMANLKRTLPFVKSIVEIKVLSTVLEAYLPQLALIVFLALLPTLLLYLSKLEGIPSQSQIERAAAGKYFYFMVFNVFLGVTIGSSLFNTLKDIEKNPNKTVSLLGDAIPPAASFFITFIALRFFVGYGLQLSRLVPLIIFHLKKKFMCKTEDEVKAVWTPKPFGYATKVPGDMLVLTIALCYAVIAPLVLPFALTYFAFGWIIARHEALKVVMPAYESVGRMWPHMHTRILAALFVSQLAMLGYFNLKKFVFSALLLVPLLIATLLFYFVSNKTFYHNFKVTPLEIASIQAKELPTVSAVVEAYTPECLSPEEDHDDKFEDAQSTVSSRRTSGITSPA